MSAVAGWDELVSTALLGTERRPLPEGLPSALARLAAGGTDPATAVLDIAAGYTAHRHGGALPPATPAPPPAPADDIPPAPDAAQHVLESLLRADERELVTQWLEGCVDRGLGVRPGLWPAVGASATAARGPAAGLVCAAVGARGVAFLERHPRWRVVAAAADPGGPDAARAVLDTTWEDLTAPRRAALLALLATDLRADDEPRLLRGLTDSRLPVRETARRLLSRLPGSDWSRWVTGRALAAVEVTRSLGRRRVVVHPPEPDAETAAHGLAEAPRAGIGPAAHLLRQLVGGADLDAWPAHTRTDPDGLLGLLRGTAVDWYADLTAGLATAAVVQQHSGWADALLRAGVGDPALVPLGSDAAVERLLDALEPHARAALLAATPGPWSAAVTDRALELLDDGRLRSLDAHRLAVAAGNRLDPARAPALARLAELDGRVAEGAAVAMTRLEIARSFDPTQEHR